MKYDGDKELGKYTFRQISVIDYSLVTVDTFSLLRNFNVLETDPIFSDGHSILRVSLYKYQRLTMEALDMASLRF